MNEKYKIKYIKYNNEWLNKKRNKEIDNNKKITTIQIEKAKEINCFFGFDKEFTWLIELDNKASHIIFS